MNNIVLISPPEKLRPYIRCFWWAAPAAQGQQYRILADGAPGLIFQHHNGHSGITYNGAKMPVAFAYGQATSPGINDMEAGTLTVGVHFRPHAWKSFVPVDAAEATNTFIELDDLPGLAVTEQLLNTAGPSRAIILLTDRLWNNLSRHRKEDLLVKHSIQRIAAQIADVHPEDLPNAYPISRRQYQRRFKQQIGVSLETYIRIVKFQHALQAVTRQSFHKLSDIGYELGYADQSHFIREFKFFSGYTPADLITANAPRVVEMEEPATPADSHRLIAC